MDETQIREMIRSEIRAAFSELATSADNYPSYDTDTIEDVSSGMLNDVAQVVADILKHPSPCGMRTSTQEWFLRECTC